MDRRIQVIKELIESGDEITYTYGDFEFLLFDIEKEDTDTPVFKLKTYSNQDNSYSVKCLKSFLEGELRSFLKYVDYRGSFDIELYDGNEILNGGYYFYLTQEFVDGLFDIIKNEREFVYHLNIFDDNEPFYFKLNHEPQKITINSNGYDEIDVTVHCFLKKATMEFYKIDKIEDVSSDVCTQWGSMVDEMLADYEIWNEIDEIKDYINTKYLKCVDFNIKTKYQC